MTNDGTWTYTYDANGNTTKKSKGANAETWTYGWDAHNRLIWAEDRQTDGGALITHLDFKYDALVLMRLGRKRLCLLRHRISASKAWDVQWLQRPVPVGQV